MNAIRTAYVDIRVMNTYQLFKQATLTVQRRLNPDYPQLINVTSPDYNAALFAELALTFGINENGEITIGHTGFVLRNDYIYFADERWKNAPYWLIGEIAHNAR